MKTKKPLCLVLALGHLAICLTGCNLISGSFFHRRQDTAVLTGLPSYAGPKASVAVLDFEVTAPKATSEIGIGLTKMLIAALINSNRFSVVERRALNTPKQEIGIPEETGVSHQEKELEAKKPNNVDIIISASVVEFEPQASGGRAGIGGGGGAGSGALGGLLGTALSKAHLALDIRIIDALAAKDIVQLTQLKGQASDFSSITVTDGSANVSLGKGLAVYTHTPMEKAIRICIAEALRYISRAIPSTYYKYN